MEGTWVGLLSKGWSQNVLFSATGIVSCLCVIQLIWSFLLSSFLIISFIDLKLFQWSTSQRSRAIAIVSSRNKLCPSTGPWPKAPFPSMLPTHSSLICDFPSRWQMKMGKGLVTWMWLEWQEFPYSPKGLLFDMSPPLNMVIFAHYD